MDSLLDGYQEPQKPEGFVSLLDGYKGVPVTVEKPKPLMNLGRNAPAVMQVPQIPLPISGTKPIPGYATITDIPITPIASPDMTVPLLPPEAGLIPMARRVGKGALQGLKNLPHALVDFANQSVEAGHEEFRGGYNPLLAFGAGSIGAFQGAGNLVDGVLNIPSDLGNAYFGYDKFANIHPLTRSIPKLIGKTKVGSNYLGNVEMLQERYPLTSMLSQELGEELPGMIAGASSAKLGLKAGKISKTAETIKDVGYGKLATHSAMGGLADGLIIDPAQGQQFDMTPEERIESRFTNAYSGAVIAPTLNVAGKGIHDVSPKVGGYLKENIPKAYNATKEVSAKVFNNAKEFYRSANNSINSSSGFDTLKSFSRNKVSPVPSLLEPISPDSSAQVKPPAIEKIAPKTVAKQKEKKVGTKQIDYDKHIYEGWTVRDFIENLEQHGIDDIMQGNNVNALSSPFKNYEELAKWCMDYQANYKEFIPDVVNHFAQKYNIPIEKMSEKKRHRKVNKKHDKTIGKDGEKLSKDVIIEKEKYNNEGDKNGLIQKIDGVRPGVSKSKRINSKVLQRKSGVKRGVSQIGRTDNLSGELFGRLNPEHKEVVEGSYKNSHALNVAIEKFITDEEYTKYSDGLPDEVKVWLKKYTGAGGLEKQGAQGRGLLSEYYTPHKIVKKMWDLTSQYIKTDGSKVLEPSSGIGRFLEHAPNNVKFDIVEINPVSAKIAELIYPDANVRVGEFQEQFIDEKTNRPLKSITPEYDIVIGNPPYGLYSGKYKGMGEGKGITHFEHYFIKRGIDSLKDNGVLTFIVPSSFLKSELSPLKSEITKNAVLLNAYRLPEKSFDTTSIGTDIIVLRKQNGTQSRADLSLDRWFEKHPENILGETLTRKNKFNKEETFVKGSIDSLDKVDTSLKEIKKTVLTSTEKAYKGSVNKLKASTNAVVEKSSVKDTNGFTEYKQEKEFSDEELGYLRDTQVDGTLPKSKYSPNEHINQFKGDLYNDFNYLQGDIYKKLDLLKKEQISESQKKIQREKLQSVLPKPKELSEIGFNPTSDLMQEFVVGQTEIKVKNWTRGDFDSKLVPISIVDKFKDYLSKTTKSERNDVSLRDINSHLNGKDIVIKYQYTYTMDEVEKKQQKSIQRAEYITRVKNSADKLFNDFVNTQLDKGTKEKLKDTWNRTHNGVYVPDYKKLPLVVRGLSSKFYGKDLNIMDVQLEGVNFLTNKGVGLLGFEVGVGKTLSGIVATVQNMQMGRCKKPLILVPDQVKDNWKKELGELFPDIEVNNLGNMSNFQGEIKEGTVSIATYNALDNIWYKNGVLKELMNKIYTVSENTLVERTKRGQEEAKFKAEEKILGIAMKGNTRKFDLAKLGFDHVTVDEAHNFRNLFRTAQAMGREGNTYQSLGGGGDPSARSARLFLLVQHILERNNNRNVFMLTATPFNNSPLEIFNMLSFLGKNELDRRGLYNVYQFMENYADLTADWVINSKNDVVYKQIVKGFKNAGTLRDLISSLMLIRSADDAGIQRPNKHIRTVVLEPTALQAQLIAEAESEAVSKRKNDGAVLKALNKSRKVTLSPHIALGKTDISAEEFVGDSPKLDYVLSAIEAMKKKDPDTSQLLYMPQGKEYIPLIKNYLVEKCGFKSNEIEIIQSGISEERSIKSQNSFNDRNGAVKLIIGTAKIREGMNLNKNSSVLYVPFLDWNPTDFVQVIGRIWRRGNRYDDIRVVVPLLKNSSDSFMFQKLEEKTSRINDVMSDSGEYIETGELNTAEEKLNMISNPDKKAKMYVMIQDNKLKSDISRLEGKKESVIQYKKELADFIDEIEYYEELVKKTKAELEKKDVSKESPLYEERKIGFDNARKKLADNKLGYERLTKRIERQEIDLEGSDSVEAITLKIAELEVEKSKLKTIEEEKHKEYSIEYKKQKNESKSISELISEFDTDTDFLYKKDKEVFDSLPLHDYEDTAEKEYSVPQVIALKASATKSKRRTKLKRLKEIDNAKHYDKRAKEDIRRWVAQIEVKRYETSRDLNRFINRTKIYAKNFGVKDKQLREIMPFLRERTEFPEGLNRPDLADLWEKLGKRGRERITMLADNISSKFERYWDEYRGYNAGGLENDNKIAIENYITHIWDLDSKKKSLLTNYFSTKSRFAKERTIKTLFEGINGIEIDGEMVHFTPKTLDYAEILKTQSDSLIKATADKQLADTIKNYKTSDGLNLVLPSHLAPADWVEIDHHALNKTVARPLGSKFGEVVAPKLQKILAQMGVGIGRRLSARLRNGKLNSYSKYIHSEPPEIRLQRWFSTKNLAHEVGHALDKKLNLSKYDFTGRFKDELLAINKERIEAFKKAGKKEYVTSGAELTAEFFAYLFNDFQKALEIAPTATSEVLKLINQNDTIKQLLPPDFNWKDAKNVLEEKMVELFKTKVKVHPDIADTIKVVFEKQGETNLFWRTYDNINSVLKQFNLGFSGFHAVALTEAALANLGLKKTIKILNPTKAFRAIKNNDWDIYKSADLACMAIKDGLQIGATIDIHRGKVEAILTDTARWAQKSIPIIGKQVSMPFKVISTLQKFNNKALWDYLHNNYKLETYLALIQSESEHGIVSQARRREIAQWVNDSYGGQVWENLGIKPSLKTSEQRALISPDWLRSTTRQFIGAFSNKTTTKFLNEKSVDSINWERVKAICEQWGLSDLTGDVKATGMRGRIARKFWFRAMIQYALYANALNAIFREKDRKENPELYPRHMTAGDYSLFGNSINCKDLIFIGRNSDGTERYWRLGKQFREVPEMATHPLEKIGGKASPMAQLITQTATGHTISGFENRAMTGKKGWGKVGEAVKMWAKAPLPYSMSSLFNTNKDMSVADFFAGTSKGMTFYKGKELYKGALNKRDKEQIREITQNLKRNKVDPNDSFNVAVKEMRKDLFKKTITELKTKKGSK